MFQKLRNLKLFFSRHILSTHVLANVFLSKRLNVGIQMLPHSLNVGAIVLGNVTTSGFKGHVPLLFRF